MKDLTVSKKTDRTVSAISTFLVVCLLALGCAKEQVKTEPGKKVSKYIPMELPPEEVPRSYVYTLNPEVNLRSGPDTNSMTLEQLEHNETLGVFGEKGAWLYVKTISGAKGYVRSDMVSDLLIKVHKRERRLYLLKKDKVIKSYRIALSSENPLRDKERLGDYGTPEGRFYICQMTDDPSQLKYGPRSMLISYPGIEDARRGFKEGLIDYTTYQEIAQAIKDGRAPSQKTGLGSQIRIHGCCGKYDWTKGCIGLEDSDVIELYAMVSPGTRVDIYKSAEQEQELNSPLYFSTRILEGAHKQLSGTALYAYQAAGQIQSDYSSGGSSTRHSAGPDTLAKIVRHANIDLESLIHEDAMLYPWRYSSCDTSGNMNYKLSPCQIRTWLSHHTQVLSNILGAQFVKYLKPGDILIMNTGASSGSQGDLMGIVDAAYEANGFPKIITVWQKPGLMNVPRDKAPTILYCFRLTQPLDYQ
jgi:uncharacterized protein YijF (DUF1287 family)